MAKKKSTKTYFVFVTLDGVIGMAAGLDCCSNQAVKELDRALLTNNGYKQVGPVFTKNGEYGLNELLKLKNDSKLCILGRVHVDYFLKNIETYKLNALISIERMKRDIEEKEAREATRVEREAEERARKDAREKNREFKTDLLRGNLEKYGFVPDGSTILPEYSKGNIKISYYGGELSHISIDGKSLEGIIDIPEAGDIDDELCYRITDEAITYLRNLIGVMCPT